MSFSCSISHSYKDSACPTNNPNNTQIVVTPQQAFVSYQDHNTVKTFFQVYVNASNTINAAGKDFVR